MIFQYLMPLLRYLIGCVARYALIFMPRMEARVLHRNGSIYSMRIPQGETSVLQHNIAFFIKKILTAGVVATLLISTPAFSKLDVAKGNLSINKGISSDNRPADGESWFAMKPGDAWTYIGVEGNNGINIGTGQVAVTNADPDGDTSTQDALAEPDIDLEWIFFNNKGLHQTLTEVKVLSDDGEGRVILDFSGWGVTWNGIPEIPMSTGAHLGADGNLSNENGQAIMTCEAACVKGERYVLDYTATVPTDSPAQSFKGVQYHVHLEGTISERLISSGNNDAPVTTGDHGTLMAGGSTTIDLTDNLSDLQGDDSIDLTTLALRNNCQGGVPQDDDNDGIVTYLDTAGVDETCSFTYTVKDQEGARSNSSTVSIRVAVGNIPPLAKDISVLTNAGENIEIDLLAQVTDSDGSLDAGSVVATAAQNGRVTIDPASGFATYRPANRFAGVDTFGYSVKDGQGVVSNVATVSVRVNAAPIADDDFVTVNRNIAEKIAVLRGDRDSDGSVDPATVVAGDGIHGTTTVDPASGIVTYLPDTGFIGEDSFTYTVKDNNGAESEVATVEITVINAPPVAADFKVSMNIARQQSLAINLLENVTDSDGTVDNTSLELVSSAGQGSVELDPASGIATYTPNSGYLGPDSFFYTIKDNEGDRSEAGKVSINVADTSGAVLNEKAILAIDTGPGGESKPDKGSWFAMEINAGRWTYTGLSGKNGVQIGADQPASSNPLTADIDNPWKFFGNLGVHQSLSTVTIINDDGAGQVTLDFSGWGVAWNSIPNIPMLDNPHGGVDGGVTLNAVGEATMVCAVDCSAEDRYVLDYTATVPPGDPSGFGNVKYHLHLEGQVLLTKRTVGGGDSAAAHDVDTLRGVDSDGGQAVLSAGGTATSVGNTSGVGLSNSELNRLDPLLNPGDGQQCIGGCVDIIATSLGAGETVDIVFRLDADIPDGSIYRVLNGQKWSGFDGSGDNQLGSADADADGNCTGPEGVFAPGLTTGARCVFLRIADGGPNDTDGAVNGAVSHLGGVLNAGSPNRPQGSTSGCSVSGDPVTLWQRADWIILAIFLCWLGWVARRRV